MAFLTGKYFRNLLKVFSIGVLLPLIGGVLFYFTCQDFVFFNKPIYAAVESTGGFISLLIVALIYINREGLKKRTYAPVVVSSLLIMGIMDIFHSVSPWNNSFVWFFTLSVFFGGAIFATVWSSEKDNEGDLTGLPFFVAWYALGFGFLTVVFSDWVPVMLSYVGSLGTFSVFAKGLNVLGGLSFYMAAFFFLKKAKDSNLLDNYLLATHCLLLGSAGFLFPLSMPWAMSWWWLVSIRLLAYAVLIYCFFNYNVEYAVQLAEHKVNLERAKFKLEAEIEERTKLEESLLDSEERMNLALKSSKSGTWEWNMETGKLYFDEYKLSLCGLRASEFSETLEGFLQVIHPDDRSDFMRSVTEAIDHDHIVDLQYKVILPDGTNKHLITRGKVFRSHRGAPMKMSGISLDITEQKDVESKLEIADKELELKAKELERSNKELENFAYVASHDLREPLRKVIAFSNKLSDKFQDKLGELGLDYILRMQRSVARMQKLLDDLLMYSRVSTQGDQFKEVDLNLIFADLISDLEERIKESSAEIIIPKDLPSIEGDETQLRQLFQNLISNSIKFVAKDISAKVEISSSRSKDASANECLVLCFKDNGIGFDPKYANDIFEQFKRLHGRSEYEGTGMGLAICRKIVERHEGSISVNSVPGEGSSFTVSLPIRQRSKTLGLDGLDSELIKQEEKDLVV